MEALANDLFVRALELPGDERDEFIREACGDDAGLLLEVRKLLVDAGLADAIFGENPDGTRISGFVAEQSTAGQEDVGDRIGPYQLLQMIGEGGFGAVWMAEQSEPIARKVALKVIKAGMDTKEVLARFGAERQALALMDHPNIARVLDAGASESGRPYFVMELVKGIPITDYCDRNELAPVDRLALFSDVCAAIQHAHQKGIIHRDIKPANVLVAIYAEKPVVKVIDFGIAKAVGEGLADETRFTRFGQFVGTPVYMSPEQAGLCEADIDTRSDIYALGILLYELLTGGPAFDPKRLASAGHEEMRRIIREDDPPKPSSRLGTVSRDAPTSLAGDRQTHPERPRHLIEPDLDWIVMKAIEKDRSRRYETASGLAADIRRFLAHEPVTAGPPGTAYQLRKFARRHQVALRIAGILAAVLVAATTISIWQAARAMRAERRAMATLAEVAAERDAKEKAHTHAEAFTTLLAGVFQSPDPTRDGRGITVAEMLDQASGELDTDRKVQPDQRARLQATLGKTYRSLGLNGKAIALQEKVREHYLNASGPEDPVTLAAMHELAVSYGQAGRSAEAIRLQEEVLSSSLEVLGAEHPDRIRGIGTLADFYQRAGRKGEAVQLREEALDLSRKALGPEHPATLVAMSHLATAHADTPGLPEPTAMREAILDLGRTALGAEHPVTLAAMNNLALSYNRTGRSAESIGLQEEVLELARRIYGVRHRELIPFVGNLRQFYQEAGRRRDALRMQEEQVRLWTTIYGPEHPSTLDARASLARFYRAAGRGAEAAATQEDLLATSRKLHRPALPATLDLMISLADTYSRIDRNEEADAMREQSRTLIHSIQSKDRHGILGPVYRLASSYLEAGRAGDGLALLGEALETRPRDPPFALSVAAIQL